MYWFFVVVVIVVCLFLGENKLHFPLLKGVNAKSHPGNHTTLKPASTMGMREPEGMLI